MNQYGKPNLKDDLAYLPPTKEERRTLLKQIISKHLTPHWLQMPKKLADLERRTLRKLIDSL